MRMALLLAASLSLGCGGPKPELSAAVLGPHGLGVVELPDGLGCIESRIEPVAASPGGAGFEIAVYFLKPDGKSPLDPRPTEAAVSLRVTGSRVPLKSVPLRPSPRADDPAGAARYATEPGPYGDRRILGQVTAKVQGRDLNVPLIAR